MEFGSKERIWDARDTYGGSMAGSDDAETLSFSDMPVYNITGKSSELQNSYRLSKTDSADHDDFHFDLDYVRSTSVPCRTSNADDLFHNGRLLPLNQYNARYSYGDSTSPEKNGLRLKENLQTWKSDSAESKTSFWTSPSPSNSPLSHRSFNYPGLQKGVRRVNSTSSSNKSKGAVNLTSFPSPKASGSCSKTLPPWLRLLTLGIIKTPVMKVEEKRKQTGANLKCSVSSYYNEDQPLVKKAVTLQQKSKSVKCNKQAEEAPRSKGLRVFRLLPSLKSFKSSINSAISCTSDKIAVDMEASLDARRPHT